MKIKRFLTLAIMFLTLSLYAQDDVPTINPTMDYTSYEEDEASKTRKDVLHEDVVTITDASCPLEVDFKANADYDPSLTPNFEWRFYKSVDPKNPSAGYDSIPFLIRYEENTTYTFTSYGGHLIKLYAIFKDGNQTVAEYTDEYYQTAKPLEVTITQSSLYFPNAFSPNGDKINDIFRAKPGYKSIVEFHAYIYNRWGKMVYDWTDPSGGWDGTINGKPAKQGVYFLYCKAKGADGVKWEYKSDINLLRDYSEETGVNE